MLLVTPHLQLTISRLTCSLLLSSSATSPTPIYLLAFSALSFHTRNNRNESTVLSTQARIFYYSLLEALSVVAMSA